MSKKSFPKGILVNGFRLFTSLYDGIELYASVVVGKYQHATLSVIKPSESLAFGFMMVTSRPLADRQKMKDASQPSLYQPRENGCFLE
jgi:hypothetical protein